MGRKSFDEVLKYTEYAMKTISQKSMNKRRTWISSSMRPETILTTTSIPVFLNTGNLRVAIRWLWNGWLRRRYIH